MSRGGRKPDVTNHAVTNNPPSLIERIIGGAKRDAGKGLPPDPTAQQRWPTLWEFLTLKVFADGSARIPSTIGIYLGFGDWCCVLNERQEGLSCFARSITMEGCLDALEAKLSGPEPDFREWRKGGAGKKKGS